MRYEYCWVRAFVSQLCFFRYCLYSTMGILANSCRLIEVLIHFNIIRYLYRKISWEPAFNQIISFPFHFFSFIWSINLQAIEIHGVQIAYKHWETTRENKSNRSDQWFFNSNIAVMIERKTHTHAINLNLFDAPKSIFKSLDDIDKIIMWLGNIGKWHRSPLRFVWQFWSFSVIIIINNTSHPKCVALISNSLPLIYTA